jgi:adenosine/AMP kinase
MKTELVRLDIPEGCNIIAGQSHFIKTVEDLYEAMVNCAPSSKFGIAFCESSGPRLVRSEGNDSALKRAAETNALKVGAGHFFLIVMSGAYPISVLHAVRDVPEVCSIFCATANPVEVVVCETGLGRGVLGVVDGGKSAGVEDEQHVKERKEFLREIRYKL